MDLCLRYRAVTLGIELKVWRPGAPDPLPEGREQLDTYLAGLGLDTGWLVIFDCRPGLPVLAERLRVIDETTPGGRRVRMVRA
jgi:hypothetical protein